MTEAIARRETYREAVMEPKELAGHMASGALAGAAVEAALYPLDTIKTRLQSSQ